MSNTRLGKILKTKFESVNSVIKPRVGLIFNFDWDGPSLVAIEKISSDSVTLNRLSTAKPVDENTNYLPKDELEDVNTGRAVKASDVEVGRVYSCDWDGQSIVAVKSIDGDDVEVVRLRKVKTDEDTLVVDKDEVLEELGFIKGDVIEFKFGNRSKLESTQTNKYKSKLISNTADNLINLGGLSWMEISTGSNLDKSTISDLIDTDDYKELEKYSGRHLQMSRRDTVRIYFDPINNSKNIKKVVSLFLSLTKPLVNYGDNHTLYLAPRLEWKITDGYLSIHRPLE